MSSQTKAGSVVARRRVLHAGSAAMLVGGIITVVGSLLPWVTTPLGSLSGMVGPGLWTLCAGFIAIAGALMPNRKIAIAHCLVPGLAVGFIAAWQVVHLLTISATTSSWGKVLPGMGLVMVSGGAVILIRAGWRLASVTDGEAARRPRG